MRTLTHTRTKTVCGHPPDNVVADILDGDFHGGPGGEQAVQWCRTCGAFRRVFDRYGERREGGWREPGGYAAMWANVLSRDGAFAEVCDA